MNSVKIFTPAEEEIVSEIKELLSGSGDSEDLRIIDDALISLNKLAEAIALYPSLLNQQNLGKHSRTLNSLVENLCSHDGLDLLLNTPTKAILGRGFLVAKMNFFILVSYICSDNLSLCYDSDNIRKTVTMNVFSLMAEEVFISIISDDTLEIQQRRKAAAFLARIWEYSIYIGVDQIEPLLTDIWISRQSFTPVFGTMQGIAEITLFCSDRNPRWLEFLSDPEFNDDTLEALKEYLIGLSYEEMNKIEEYMRSESISSLKHSDIEKALDAEKLYPMIDYHDPREMYHFYARRKDNAVFRKKSGIDGPKRTIEEHLVCYLLKNNYIKINGE